MLRACRRILKPGGRIAFLTIQPTPGLSPARRRAANRAGPVAVAVRTSYVSMLRSAGYREIDAVDVTEDYRATQLRWIEAHERLEPGLRLAMGDELFDERSADRVATLAAIDAGLLARFRYRALR